MNPPLFFFTDLIHCDPVFDFRQHQVLTFFVIWNWYLFSFQIIWSLSIILVSFNCCLSIFLYLNRFFSVANFNNVWFLNAYFGFHHKKIIFLCSLSWWSNSIRRWKILILAQFALWFLDLKIIYTFFFLSIQSSNPNEEFLFFVELFSVFINFLCCLSGMLFFYQISLLWTDIWFILSPYSFLMTISSSLIDFTVCFFIFLMFDLKRILLLRKKFLWHILVLFPMVLSSLMFLCLHS